MKIQVLGSGCPTCKTLYELVMQTVKEMGLDEEVEYVTDINKLIEEGIATSPALKIGGEVVSAGRVPSVDEIKEFISNKCKSDKSDKSGQDKNKECACGGSC